MRYVSIALQALMLLLLLFVAVALLLLFAPERHVVNVHESTTVLDSVDVEHGVRARELGDW